MRLISLGISGLAAVLAMLLVLLLGYQTVEGVMAADRGDWRPAHTPDFSYVG